MMIDKVTTIPATTTTELVPFVLSMELKSVRRIRKVLENF
jgi:hypothetical protein